MLRHLFLTSNCPPCLLKLFKFCWSVLQFFLCTDFSLLNYLKVEVTKGSLLDEQGEKYIDQREKVYTFMKTPRELEKVLSNCLPKETMNGILGE